MTNSDKWEVVKLGDILLYEQPTKYIVSNDTYDNSFSIPVLTAGKSFILGYTDEDENIFTKTPVIIFDDFTTSIKFVDFPFKVKSSAMKILNPTDKINIKYIYYLMTTIKSDTGLHKRYWISKYANIEIPLPSLETQKKIADELDKITSLIEKRKTQIEKLDLLVKAKFIEMFGDPVLNPMGWEMKKWQDVLIIKNGKNQKKVESPYGEYPIYGSGGIMAYANDYICNENSVIIGRKGNINKPILVKEKYWNVDTAFGLEPKLEMLVCEYLYFFCVWYDFEQLNKTVTIPSLTKSDLLALKMPLPPLNLQNEFAKYIEKIDKIRYNMGKGLEQLETLYKQRMQEYFE